MMQNFTPLIYFIYIYKYIYIYIYILIYLIYDDADGGVKWCSLLTVLVTYYVIIFIPRLNGRQQQLNSAHLFGKIRNAEPVQPIRIQGCYQALLKHRPRRANKTDSNEIEELFWNSR